MNLMHNATAASLATGCLVAAVSIAGLVRGAGGLYGDPTARWRLQYRLLAFLSPGLLGHDVFNLVVALPLLLGGILLWRPTTLGYVAVAGLLVGVLAFVIMCFGPLAYFAHQMTFAHSR